MKIVLVSIVVFCFVLSVQAGVYIVGDPTDYVSITNAVASAVVDTTIHVSTGTYHETVRLYGKSLTIDGGYDDSGSSKAGSGRTVINADEDGAIQFAAVYITNSNVELIDLDFTDGAVGFGASRDGGGVVITDDSAVTARTCYVYRNSAAGAGGGIYIENSMIYMEECAIFSNTAYTSFGSQMGAGGGLAADYSTVFLDATAVSINLSEEYGGGLYLRNGTQLTIEGADGDIEYNRSLRGGGVYVTNAYYLQRLNADLSGNTASNDGGGIYLIGNAHATLTGSSTYLGYNLVTNNAVTGFGGGVYVDGSELTISSNAAVDGGICARDGGGIFLTNDSVCLLDGTLIGVYSGNHADKGGGIAAYDSSLTITNTAIRDGYAVTNGGGIYLFQSTLAVYNSTIGNSDPARGNTADNGYGGGLYTYYSSIHMDDVTVKNNGCYLSGGGAYCSRSLATFTNCVFEDNDPSRFGGGVYISSTGLEMANCTVNSNSATSGGGGMYFSSVSNAWISDTVISRNSANTGAGVMSYMNGSATARFDNVSIEYNTASQNGGGVYSGEGVTDARDCYIKYNTAAGYGEGGGVFLRYSAHMTFRAENTNSFITHNNAGFGGGVHIQEQARLDLLADSPYDIYLTSNDSATNGGGICVVDTGSVTVVGSVNIGGNDAGERGGGLYAGIAATVSFSATNGYAPYLYNNEADDLGGAICLEGDATTATLHSVTIGNAVSKNFATYGGGIAISDGVDAELVNCTICDNVAGSYGGGIYASDSDLLVRSDYDDDYSEILPPSRIYNNYSTNNGGGLYVGAGQIEMSDTCIYSNSTAQRGGGMYLGFASEALLYNMLMVNNSANMTGDHIRAFSYGTKLTILASTVMCDTSTNGSIAISIGPDLYMTNSIVDGGVSTNQSVNYCDIQGGYATGVGNISFPPEFFDEEAFDFRLRYGSPCTNQGTAIAWITNDIMNGTRPVGAFDMGAYEYDGFVYDTDGDQMVDSWEDAHSLNPENPADAMVDSDFDTYTNLYEYIADTNPWNSNDYFRIVTIICTENSNDVRVPSSAYRLYNLAFCDDIAGETWFNLLDQTEVPGTGGIMSMIDSNAPAHRSYRATVQLPE